MSDSSLSFKNNTWEKLQKNKILNFEKLFLLKTFKSNSDNPPSEIFERMNEEGLSEIGWEIRECMKKWMKE